ncbi:MAG: SecD/SecF fusion protein [Solirubrobacteraceae bacterium]|jgi:SecD/SecF fusion protein|nr:SecD/SecF fusion protein [Solirubrobacteraceae bacterium]
MSPRRRNLFVLLLVAGLLIASGLVIATKPTRLGLDLKGGVELVYQAKPTPAQPQVTPEAIDRAIEIMRERVDALGVSEPEIQRSGSDQISVGLPAVKNAERAQQQVGRVAQLYFYDWETNVLGPDLKADPSNPSVTGGQSAGQVGGLSLYDAVKRAAKRPPVKHANRTANDQYYLFGPAPRHKLIAGPTETERDLFSELPGRRAPRGSEVVKINTGTIVVKAEKPANAGKGIPDTYYVLNDNPALSGRDITDPKQTFNSGAAGSGAPVVTFSFTDKGRKAWANVTREIAQRGLSLQIPGQPAQASFQHFAAVLDGQLITVPFISFTDNPDGIDGRQGSQIEGGFTITSAQDLAKLLKIGALPLKLELISQSQVSASLGREALNQGLLAGGVGLALVVLFLLAFYRLVGLVAVAALGVYAAYFFALIKLIPVTMTLPGIAGLILTIGVAADANIVIFERVKEEIRAGASMSKAISAGYKKGLTAIVDANVVTLMTAFILFILATAGVKGFAFTLGIGTIVSLFTAVMATQAILVTLGRSRLLTKPGAMGVGEQKHKFRFDFMGRSKWFFSMSGVILVIGALSIGANGLPFGIDFESGTRISTALQKPATESDVRAVLASVGAADAKIQKVNNPKLGKNVFQVSTSNLRPDEVQKVRRALDTKYGVGDTFSSQSIGPTFGQTVANSAIIAVIASLLVISIYVALRFEWKYAVPVLIALAHDLLITAGVYSLAGREVTSATVAALLTILGYSLYDGIIVFDRVRENVPRMPRAAFSQIVNRSMSEVLLRSLITGASALVLVISLLIFGGETLRDFAFALMVGILSGAYSSIFIAAPVLTHWKERERVYEQRADRIRRENNGVIPAYAVATVAGAPVEGDAPVAETSRRQRRRALAADQPDEVSPDEFEEMVADLGLEGDGAPAQPEAEAKPEPAPAAEPASVSRTSSTGGARPKKDKPKRPRNKRHGRNR